MAISNYSELKSAIAKWMDRETDADFSGQAADFVTLAEAQLNRKLKGVGADVSLTGSVGSRSIDISSYNVKEPIAVFLKDSVTSDELELIQKSDGTFPYLDENGEPEIWSVDGNNIDFDCPLDQAYQFRFRYYGRFALSDAAPTNDLLTENPDVYLAACIVWGASYIDDDGRLSKWATLLQEFLDDAANAESQRRKGDLSVDPMLGIIGHGRYNWVERP